ncbi:MAG: nucleotidyltransferase domain-containing protein [Bacteroidota bacterium]
MTLAPDEIPRAEVVARLRAIEAEHDVRVVYAVESGSRAWGFASQDSDVDVRFLYARKPAWYLSVHPGRDVIETPVEGVFDVSGWDVRKALGLFAKSNPPLLEWLRSPLVYLEETPAASVLRGLTPAFYSPRACFYHYQHMAASTYRSELRGESVKPKKYFYVLRPILCCHWIGADPEAPPPVVLDRLMDRFLPSGPVRESVDALLAAKRAGAEGDRIPPIPPLQSFIEAELDRLDAAARDLPRPEANRARLDVAFREILDAAWHDDGALRRTLDQATR